MVSSFTLCMKVTWQLVWLIRKVDQFIEFPYKVINLRIILKNDYNRIGLTWQMSYKKYDIHNSGEKSIAPGNRWINGERGWRKKLHYHLSKKDEGGFHGIVIHSFCRCQLYRYRIRSQSRFSSGWTLRCDCGIGWKIINPPVRPVNDQTLFVPWKGKAAAPHTEQGSSCFWYVLALQDF